MAVGLDGTVVLEDASLGVLDVAADGWFAFATALESGASYDVGIRTAPAHQQCSIANGAGTVAGHDVSDIMLTCATRTFTVGGTVSGLTGTLVLENDGRDAITLDADGAFTFPTSVALGAIYDVAVAAQPEGQTCVVTGGSGTVAAEVTDVAVACTTNHYVIGGIVAGLDETLVLQNNGRDDLTLGASGPFAFATAIPHGSTYDVTILSQPPSQQCTLAGATGVATGVATGEVSSVTVTCATDTHVVGGTVSGLTGSIVLRNNGGDSLTLSEDGAFTFATPLASGATYDVTVATQPTGQTCTVANGTGTATSDVSNVSVTCTTSTYTIGGTISGLAGTLVLRNKGGDDLTRTASGSFTFATPVAPGGTYDVTVLTQPTGQTCTVAGGSGTATANVTSVFVTCVTRTYAIGGTISGLTGIVVLQNNGGDDLILAVNVAFTFATRVAHGSPYAVSVLTQPNAQVCSVTNGSGTAVSDVTDVGVDCAAAVPDALDPTFGDGGIVLRELSTTDDGINDIALQADGKIVAAGAVYAGSEPRFGLARFDSDGSLDTTFGTGGVVVPSFADGMGSAISIAVQSDGKIVAAGAAMSAAGTMGVAVARVTSSGAPDTTFASEGLLVLAQGLFAQGLAIATQSDGKLVIGGVLS